MPRAAIQFSEIRRSAFDSALADFLNFKAATGRAPGTVRDYDKFNRAFFRRYPAAWDSPAEMRAAFLSWIEDDIAPATYNLRFINVRAFWRWCVEEGMQPETPDPFRGLHRRIARGRFVDIDAEKVKELLRLPDRSTWTGFRDYTLILFTLDTATRPGEALRLVPENFNLRSMCAIIPASVAKTREERIIPFSPSTAQTLRRFLKARPPEWGARVPVFASIGGRRLPVEDWSRRLRRKYRLQDGFYFRAYDLRHAACTLHLRAGMTGEALQRLMGHHGPQMTQRYIHLTSDDLRQAQAVSSPVARLMPSRDYAPRKLRDIN